MATELVHNAVPEIIPKVLIHKYLMYNTHIQTHKVDTLTQKSDQDNLEPCSPSLYLGNKLQTFT